MIWGKSKENVIRILPWGLRGNVRGKFLFKGHDSLYWRTRWTEVRLMKFWRV
jgi:hypothetical protein